MIGLELILAITLSAGTTPRPYTPPPEKPAMRVQHYAYLRDDQELGRYDLQENSEPLD